MSGSLSNTSTLFDPQPLPEPRLVLFLDECIPTALADRLLVFLADRPEQIEMKHLLDFYKQGHPDREWARLVKENRWLPITADRGQTNRGEKLPKIFKEMGVVHIVLSARVHQLSVQDKALAIVACWLEIVDVWRNQRGCCHSLRFRDIRAAGFKLVDVDAAKAK